MQHFTSYSILLIIYFLLKFFFKNFKSKFYKNHQKLAGKESIPLIGGMVFFCYYSYTISLSNINYLIFTFLILLLGILSDNNFLQSPKLRLILQSFILLIFLHLSNLQVNDLRNDFLNSFLYNYYSGLIFTTFCLLVLINGSNFIDGLDGLNLGYFFLISIVIYYLWKGSIIDIDIKQLNEILYVITFLLILNILNYLYIGDSGSYLIGFIFGIFLIEINNYNYFLSPYFIALLLWYPAFENLFSIIRKRMIKEDPLKPDNLHFHQLLFNFFKKKNNQFIKNFSNFISSVVILLYNAIIFLISLNFINHTKILIILLFLNIFNYLITYFFLKKYNN